MKKRIAVFVLIIVAAFCFLGCKPAIEKYQKNISELRDNVFVAESDGFIVTAMTGIKESPFVLDGKATGAQDFTLITIEPTEFMSGIDYEYYAVIDNAEYAGRMVQHPFGKSFSVNIDVRCYGDSIFFRVSYSGNTAEFNLASIKTSDMISASKAVDIASQRLSEQIKTFEGAGQLNAEIYVRLIANPIDTSGGYHWYVAFVGEDQTLYAVLIHPISMDIVAVRD